MCRLRGMIIVLGLMLGLLPAGGARAAATLTGTLPQAWKQTTWEGVVVSYDSRRYAFVSGRPDDRRARIQASITQSPNPCLSRAADCSADAARLVLFPSGGMDVRSWVAHYLAALV